MRRTGQWGWAIERPVDDTFPAAAATVVCTDTDGNLNVVVVAGSV